MGEMIVKMKEKERGTMGLHLWVANQVKFYLS